MRIAVGSDHAGFALKEHVSAKLTAQGLAPALARARAPKRQSPQELMEKIRDLPQQKQLHCALSCRL